MKITTKITPGKFVCGDGRVRAEGKHAKPTFCYRLKTRKALGKEKILVEFHSKVTGKRIGYLGMDKPLVQKKEEANAWANIPTATQDTLTRAMRHFIKTAQDPKFDPKASPLYRKAVTDAWKVIVRAAKS